MSRRWRQVIPLLAGLVASQVILYWPCFRGTHLLAPTDVLLNSGALGREPKYADHEPQNDLLWDPVQVFYPWLEFAAREVRAGRLPLWNPYAFCGSPLLANNQSAIFSPFTALYYVWPDPRVLVWIQLAKVLLAGVGTYGFLRELGRSRWAATVGGWCFPLSGFMVAWLSYPLSATAVWLPVSFWAVEVLVKRPGAWSVMSAAASIGAMLVSGHLETAAHVLATLTFFGVWRWVEQSGGRVWTRPALTIAASGLVAAVFGLALSAAQLLPTLDYLDSSLRLFSRKSGWGEKRLPRSDVGPEFVRTAFPYTFGTQQRGSRELTSTVFNEGGVNGYVGFVMLAILVPAGLAHGRRGSIVWCWTAMALLSAAPAFRLPLLRMWEWTPPFDVMRNDRMLLMTGWAVLMLGTRGIDVLADRSRRFGWSDWLSSVVASGCLVLFCVLALAPPDRLQAATGDKWPWFRAHFLQNALVAAAGLTIVGANVIAARRRDPAIGTDTNARSHIVVRRLTGMAVVGELLLSAWGCNPIVEPETYYPGREFVSYLQQHVGEGRICGIRFTLPPNVAMMYELKDVRGYDAVDPLPYLELIQAINPFWQSSTPYAATLSFWSGPSPLLNLLAVRYVIAAQPIETPAWPLAHRANELWIYENPAALPRAFVPRRALSVPLRSDRLAILADPQFDPNELVLISEPIALPAHPMLGTATIVRDEPRRVVLDVRLDTDSVVVLSDSFSAGWEVSVDGRAARPLVANHALRGVQVSAGSHEIEWRYEPAAVRRGLFVSAAALALLVAWCLAYGFYRIFRRFRSQGRRADRVG